MAPCILDVGEDTNRLPKMCPYGVNGTIWHEVKEAVTDCNQLPVWCKVGAIIYNTDNLTYFEVAKIDNSVIHGRCIESGIYEYEIKHFAQARKRPYNAEEMRGLLGKVIVDGESEFFVSAYYGEVKYLAAGLFCEFDAQSLMRCSCDGKPCYVLEHLENGEWVK